MGRQSLILALPLTATYCATRSRKLITTTKRREGAYLLLSLPLPSPSRPLRSSVITRRSSASTAAASLKQQNPAVGASSASMEICQGSSSSSTTPGCQGSSSSKPPRSAWSSSSLAPSPSTRAVAAPDPELIGSRESHSHSDNAKCAKKRHAQQTTTPSSSTSTSPCTTVTPRRSEEERRATGCGKEDAVGVEEKDGSKAEETLVCRAVEIDKTSELVEALPQVAGNNVGLQARQELQPKDKGFDDGVSFLWRLALGTGAVCVGLAVISFTTVPSAVVMSAGIKPAIASAGIKVAGGSSALIAPASQSVAPLVTLCQSIPSSAMPSALAGMAPAVRALSISMADNMPYNPHGGDTPLEKTSNGR